MDLTTIPLTAVHFIYIYHLFNHKVDIIDIILKHGGKEKRSSCFDVEQVIVFTLSDATCPA